MPSGDLDDAFSMVVVDDELEIRTRFAGAPLSRLISVASVIIVVISSSDDDHTHSTISSYPYSKIEIRDSLSKPKVAIVYKLSQTMAFLVLVSLLASAAVLVVEVAKILDLGLS